MFRILTRQEKTIILREFNKWGIFNYLQDKVLAVKECENSIKYLFLIPSVLENLIFYPCTCYGGLPIGNLHKKNFLPSITFFNVVAKYSNNFLYVIVNSNGEKLILYGRDVFGNSIEYASPGIEENSIILILSESKELLGVGRARFSTTKIKENGKVTINTLLDIGTYLRLEKNPI
ncbi:MAG TPA: PUA domain-containing protein [Nitrososphaeraceae archaeon]